jgi:hypothetical protein
MNRSRIVLVSVVLLLAGLASPGLARADIAPDGWTWDEAAVTVAATPDGWTWDEAASGEDATADGWTWDEQLVMPTGDADPDGWTWDEAVAPLSATG